MATNLISLIMEYLTPELIGRIASALGLDRNNASTAIGASVPALLAGICGAATQPGGAQKLLDSARQQTGTLDKFSSMIGGDKAGLIDKGSQMLSSLFSSQQQTALAGAVGKFSGLNTGTGSSLLGMLARLSWVPLPGSLPPVAATPVLSAVSLLSKRTISPSRCPQALVIC